jgi:hypothetical protein
MAGIPRAIERVGARGRRADTSHHPPGCAPAQVGGSIDAARLAMAVHGEYGNLAVGMN